MPPVRSRAGRILKRCEAVAALAADRGQSAQLVHQSKLGFCLRGGRGSSLAGKLAKRQPAARRTTGLGLCCVG
jgi:hypothetical protein